MSASACRATSRHRRDIHCGGILSHLVEDFDLQAGRSDEAARPPGVTGGNNTFVRDHQSPTRTEFSRQFADALDRVFTEDNPRPGE
jgi:hypothetical protein